MVGNSTDHDHISVSDGVLTLTATPTSGQGTSTSSPYLTIDYFSGTIYAKEQVLVDGTDAVGLVSKFFQDRLGPCNTPHSQKDRSIWECPLAKSHSILPVCFYER